MLASPFPNAIAGEERIADVGDSSLPNRVVRRLVEEEGRRLDATDGKLGTVFGIYSDGEKTGRYSWVIENRPEQAEPALPKADGSGLPVVERPRIAAALSKKLDAAGEGELVPVVVTLREKLTAELRETDLSLVTSFDARVVGRAERKQRFAERVAVRQLESESKQANLRAWLGMRGVPAAGIGTFWSSNALTLRAPAALVRSLAEHADVERVELNHDTPTTAADTWDGTNLKSSSGLNANKYINNLNLGDRVNPATGFPIAISFLDTFFADDHPVFQHSPGVSKIIGLFTCMNDQPCVWGLPAPTVDDAVHGSWCASAAAGAAMNGQIGGTTSAKRDRTGVAEQTELTFIKNGGISNTIRALEQSVAWANDIVSESFGGGDGVCDGSNAGWPEAVYAAHQAGVLVVGSAGNSSHAGGCTLTGLAEAPSQFVVGATDDPGTGAYSSVGTWSGSSRGGIDVTIAGGSFPQALSGVSALVPLRWRFAAGKNGTFDDVGGTSLAAPQVAGVAALLKDWLIGVGMSNQANLPGVLFTNLLAMTDRSTSSGTKATSRFDPVTGGGRLQARLFDRQDHPTGPFRWEAATYTLANGQHVLHRVGGAGNEPAGIQTFKVYATFFEPDGTNIADIDVTVKDKGCGTGSGALGSDLSRDVKSMVSIGSAASGKDICVDLSAFHVPAGETRQVTLVAYYTNETSMR